MKWEPANSILGVMTRDPRQTPVKQDGSFIENDTLCVVATEILGRGIGRYTALGAIQILLEWIPEIPTMEAK